ncbi:hypothetical protein BGZ98_005031 [Dissophora globulifera]|nr:hypothetical protein BGZ98_005031 [Dissophora globulifera]
MASQPASAHLPTRVVATGAFTTAVVSQNFLQATARSKSSLTQIDSLRASYPLKLLSPASTNTTFLEHRNDNDNGARNNGDDSLTLPESQHPRRKLPPPPRIVYVITYGGGLLADDHPDLQFVLKRHAKLLVLGQGNTKIYKSPRPDYPPASQTLHSTIAPGALLLYLGPPVVACEDSSVFLRHEVVLQAQRKPVKIFPENESQVEKGDGGGEEAVLDDEDDELPNCVVLDWIAGGRGEEERWQARRSEWRLIVRWAELDPETTTLSNSDPTTSTEPNQEQKAEEEEEEEDEEEEFLDEEDPRDVADRLAGGPVIFRDGFLIEHNPPLPSKSPASTSTPSKTKAAPDAEAGSGSTPMSGLTSLRPKLTSYAPSLYPHSTIGSLFIMGPKTRRLQQSILRRFGQLTVYPGQKPQQRADFPILWSVTVVQVPRPPAPNQKAPSSLHFSTFNTIPKRKRVTMNAMVVKMASQGIEQMQNFLKSLFEEQAAEQNNMMDSDDDDRSHKDYVKDGHGDNSSGGSESNGSTLGRKKEEEELSVIDELFGGRTVWERAFR